MAKHILLTSLASLATAVRISPWQNRALTLGFYGTPEVQQPVGLQVEGTIPPWITGSLYRGAAGTWDVGNFSAEHWFDGFSRNHRFEIADGKVSYQSRNGSDEYMDFVEEYGRIPGGSFAQDPCKVMFGAFEVTFRDGINAHGNRSAANVGVTWIPNFPGLASNITQNAPFRSLVMTTEANSLQQINPETLEPIELFTYQASSLELNSTGRSAAHASRDFDGTAYNYVLDIARQEYKVFGIDPRGQTAILARVTDAPPAYIHSLFSTENHVILIVWQADYDGQKLQQERNILDSLKPFNQTRDALFYVIDKRGAGVIAKYTSDAFFAFHEINSFEKDGSVYVDLPHMRNYDFLWGSQMENLRANVGRRNGSAKHDVPGMFRRYKLPHISNSTRSANGDAVSRRAEVVFDLDFARANIELPQIHPDYRGKPYQFAYGVHVEKRGFFADSIVKVDTHSRKWKIWVPDVDALPSEPVFIPSPRAESEDDGVLLTVSMDSRERRSSLVFIDAKTMKQVARARMPIAMGYGFHGAWAGADGVSVPEVA